MSSLARTVFPFSLASTSELHLQLDISVMTHHRVEKGHGQKAPSEAQLSAHRIAIHSDAQATTMSKGSKKRSHDYEDHERREGPASTDHSRAPTSYVLLSSSK